jgi:glycosyltransferase involved in cell wall biosynthesis
MKSRFHNNIEMKQPKVLFIVPLPPPVHGSTVMCQYIKDSNLINGAFCCDYVNLTTSRSTDDIGSFKLIKLWRIIVAYITVFIKLLTKKYELCYVALAFKGSFLKDAPFVLLCKLFRKRILIHLHGKGATEGARKWYYRQLLKVTFKRTKVVLLSWLLYPDVKKYVKKDNVYVCPNGVPTVDYVHAERQSKETKLLFLSNLIETKGVIVFLDAMRLLKDKGYTFKCDFVGGESKDINVIRFEEELENRGLKGIVSYQGRKYGKEKNEVFDNSDVFVFHTFYDNECFPLVLLEAMQHGLPIVTTNEGAIADIVKNGVNGFICKRRNAQSLADCLSMLIENESLRLEMGRTNYMKYHESFTIECFENTLHDIFKRVL